MRGHAITTATRAAQLGSYRSLSTTIISRAAAATASTPSDASTPSTSADAAATTPTSTPVVKRSYSRRTAVPASSASRAVPVNKAAAGTTSSPLTTAATRARAARAPAKTAAPPPPSDEAALATAAAEADDVSAEDLEPVDHTLQAFSGIDDYAHLAPSPAPSPPKGAPARAPRRAVTSAPRSSSTNDQPTPSPPMTSLPTGTSTLPMIGGYPGMPIPATLVASESMGAAHAQVGGGAALRLPDIPGEVAAPAGSDWSTSFYGLSQQPFSKEVAEALLRPLEPDDVELKPDGLLYLPEIKYRRTLNAAFGPGGWGLAPRGETNVGPKIVSREWGLVCLGRLVSVARGEQEYFDPSGIPTATEACKSNALMRCCKDLGIASELWDPRFIREYKAKYCDEVFTEHLTKKTKRKQWRKKGAKFEYPWRET